MVYYDPSSPSGLRWKVERRRGKGYTMLLAAVGDVAGTFDKAGGYWKVCVDYVQYRCHRLVYALFNKGFDVADTSLEVDHFDGNRENNAIENLRAVTRVKNQRNIGKAKNNKTGITGVMRHESSRGDKCYAYYRAVWSSLEGAKQFQKNFSILTHGEEEAFRLACEYRAKMFEELNAQGAGYTEDHGVREIT